MRTRKRRNRGSKEARESNIKQGESRNKEGLGNGARRKWEETR